MRVRFPKSTFSSILACAVLLFAMGGCRNSSIIGKWRMAGDANATVWVFKSNGGVLVGDVQGRYKFGDQDRIKIETPFATTVYVARISRDQLVLEEPGGGSTLEFTRVRETQR